MYYWYFSMLCLHDKRKYYKYHKHKIDEKKINPNQMYSLRLFFTDVNIFRRILTVIVFPLPQEVYFAVNDDCCAIRFMLYMLDILYSMLLRLCALQNKNFDIRFWPKILFFISCFFLFFSFSFSLIFLLFSSFFHFFHFFFFSNLNVCANFHPKKKFDYNTDL